MNGFPFFLSGQKITRVMATPLGDIKVYEVKVSIPVQVTLSGSKENLRLLVRAQACKDTTCLAPSNWIIPVKFK